MAETDLSGSAATTKRNRVISRKFWLGRGGTNSSSERTVESFLWQITSHKDNHVFLNQWTPVAVGAGTTVLRADVTDHTRVPPSPQNCIFSEYPCNLASFRCKNFSLKQASGLMRLGRGEPSPWIRHWKATMDTRGLLVPSSISFHHLISSSRPGQCLTFQATAVVMK